ncbi:MAG: sugar ABC transporter permease [Chloroflexota bacterium]
MTTLQAAASPSTRGKQGVSLRTIEIRWGTLFVLPWIIGFLLFTAGPMVVSLYLSFTNYNLLENQDPVWVGGQNYADILSLEIKPLTSPTQDAGKVLDHGYGELSRFGNIVIGARDPDFWVSLRVTALFAFIGLPLGIVVALGYALLLNNKVAGIRIFRTLIYSPVIVPSVVTAILFLQLLGKDRGWLNQALSTVGIIGPDWLNRAEWVIPGLVIIGLWTAGGSMIIYLAGLQSIPTELYEAASIDGANVWVRFRRVTLPLLTPVILYDLVLGLIGTFQYFIIPYTLTNGQGTPNKASFFFNMYLYKSAFVFGKMGYASALAWVLFVIVITLTIIVFRTSGRWVFYTGGGKV